ncbi:MAG TPA: histidine kinase, partial [Candidatus Binatia bacterium]|nr:histidine kinase [Candidatus Binatia bacterium]
VATWSNGSFEWDGESDGDSQPVIAEPLAHTSFLCHDLRKASPRVLYSDANRFNFWQGTPFNSEFQTQYAIDSDALCTVLPGDYLEGQLIFLDKRSMTSDDLVLAEIVARMVAARMDNLYLLNQLKETAASNERIQLSHKLHDSLLQSLAVMGMQVEIITRLFQQNPDAAKATLAKMRDMLFEGSRNLRSIVAELKRTRPAANGSAASGNRGSGKMTAASVRTRVA